MNKNLKKKKSSLIASSDREFSCVLEFVGCVLEFSCVLEFICVFINTSIIHN